MFGQTSFTYSGNYSWSGTPGNWQISFLTDGTLVVKTVAKVDVHCVGGGGGGGVEGWGGYAGAGGGGGGYTTTSKNLTLLPGSYNITIGTGGGTGTWDNANDINTRGGTGGTTSISGAINVSAAGGQGGWCVEDYGATAQIGGNGGSGGGAGSIHPGNKQTAGASDGADAVNDENWLGGHGQGRTTKDFGDNSGTLRSGGGGGGGYPGGGVRAPGGAGGGGYGGIGWDNGDTSRQPTNGTPNYGGGGGGGGTGNWVGGTGGSGIVLIRSAR